MPSSITRRVDRDPFKLLSLAVLKQSLIDARAGKPIDLRMLEPWAVLAGIHGERLRRTFQRITAGDSETLRLLGILQQVYRCPTERRRAAG